MTNHTSSQDNTGDVQLLIDAAQAAGYRVRTKIIGDTSPVMVQILVGAQWVRFDALHDDKQVNELAAIMGVSTMHMLDNDTCMADVDESQGAHRVILEYVGESPQEVAATMRRAVVTVVALTGRNGGQHGANA